jgi:hypothetical protein
MGTMINKWFDWRGILLGIGLGLFIGLMGGLLMRIFGIPVSYFVQVMLMYLPAGFCASWRGKGKGIVNSVVVGVILFTISTFLEVVQGIAVFDVVFFITRTILSIGLAVIGGLLTILFR